MLRAFFLSVFSFSIVFPFPSLGRSVFFPFPGPCLFPFSTLGGLRGRGPGPYPGTPGQTCISGILTSLNFLVEI